MVNYIYNVQFKEKSDKEGVSQRDVVSAYFINKPIGPKIDYHLVLADTSGIGETYSRTYWIRLMQSVSC